MEQSRKLSTRTREECLQLVTRVNKRGGREGEEAQGGSGWQRGESGGCTERETLAQHHKNWSNGRTFANVRRSAAGKHPCGLQYPLVTLHQSTGGHSESAIHHLERNDGVTQAVRAFVSSGTLDRFIITLRQVPRLITNQSHLLIRI